MSPQAGDDVYAFLVQFGQWICQNGNEGSDEWNWENSRNEDSQRTPTAMACQPTLCSLDCQYNELPYSKSSFVPGGMGVCYVNNSSSSWKRLSSARCMFPSPKQNPPRRNSKKGGLSQRVPPSGTPLAPQRNGGDRFVTLLFSTSGCGILEG